MAEIQVALAPSVIPAGVPPGLEFLLPTNKVVAHEVRQWGLFSIHANKQYDILDCWGRRMYFAGENPAGSYCGGSERSWIIDVYNCLGQPILTGSREGGCGCDSNVCYVSSTPTGMSLGGIVQEPSFMTNCWNIVDGAGAKVLFLDAPMFSGGFGWREFPIMTPDEPRQQLGRITRDFEGFFITEDVFGVEFPVNLDVKIKAVLIYAAFLIDFMYYEKDR